MRGSFRLPQLPLGSKSLSLVDLALMASLTYEPQDRVAEGLRHYFPTWYIEECPVVEDMDWTRFLMITSQDHMTTVISVRGTVTFRDVLQDVSLWLVPSLMIGPDVSSGVWGKAVARMSDLIPTAQDQQDTTFKSVLVATEYMLRPMAKAFSSLSRAEDTIPSASFTSLGIRSAVALPSWWDLSWASRSNSQGGCCNSAGRCSIPKPFAT